jgi:membrane-associated progesterone receptor component
LVPLRDVSPEELAAHDGVARPGSPLLLAIRGVVFDVSKGRAFYGPDGAGMPHAAGQGRAGQGRAGRVGMGSRHLWGNQEGDCCTQAAFEEQAAFKHTCIA